jgi:glutaredoxin 3
MAARVVVYLTEYCPFCHAARRLLQDKGVDFDAIRVEGRPDLRTWMREASGQSTVPQIFINGRSIGGFSDMDALDRAGELDPLLAESPSTAASQLPR